METTIRHDRFIIESENLRLELEIASVDSLLLHERTFPHVANKLILEFENLVNLENPIIIDRNNIVLDGNHRTYVFKKLHFKHIPVCRIDYLDQSTKLRYWFRLLRNVVDLEIISRAVRAFHGILSEVGDIVSLQRVMAEQCYCCGIQQAGFFAVIRFSEEVVRDAVTAYDMLERFQDELIEKGVRVEYIPCQYAQDQQFCECLKEEEIILWTPQISKEMVVDAAKKEKLFAAKSTRHLIPARPINLNFPARMLKEPVPLREMNRRFLRFMEAKEVKRLPPGQVINGRYYEEELFVFVDRRLKQKPS
jgi:L-serine kinase (ADP)